MPHVDAGSARARTSWWNLYGLPIAAILSVMFVSLAFAWALDLSKSADFHTFWDSARAFRAGDDIYTGVPLRPGSAYNLNPPAAVLLFLPFSYLPLVPAFVVWIALQLAAYFVAARQIARAIAPGRTGDVAALVLASQATFSGLHLGQVTALLMVVLTAAWVADRRDRPFTAGLLVGVAIGFKLFLGVFAGYALWRRARGFAAGLFAGAAAVTLVGYVAAGAAAYRSWQTVLAAVSWLPHLANASLLGFISRELTASPGLILTSMPLTDRPEWVRPIWIASVAIVIGLSAWRLLHTRDRDRAWAMTLAAGILISPLGWVYYAPLLAGPLLAVGQRSSRSTRALLVAGYCCFLVPYGVIARPLGPAATLAFAAVYTWGFLIWFVAVVRRERDETVVRSVRL